MDNRQVFILVLHYLALAMPFFFSGMALGILLSKYPEQAGATYAVNLLGSAFGCVIALLAPAIVGGEGMVTLSAMLAGIAAICATRLQPIKNPLSLAAIAMLMITLLDLSLRLATPAGLPALACTFRPTRAFLTPCSTPVHG